MNLDVDRTPKMSLDPVAYLSLTSSLRTEGEGERYLNLIRKMAHGEEDATMRVSRLRWRRRPSKRRCGGMDTFS